jgi:hypothetical protein
MAVFCDQLPQKSARASYPISLYLQSSPNGSVLFGSVSKYTPSFELGIILQ